MKSVIICDMEGVIQEMNKGALKMFGYTKKELIGKKRVSIFSDPSMLTMLANDFGYENAYLKFLEYHVEDDTLVILMSSGGESENIIKCQKYCDENKIDYGVLTGFFSNNRLRTRSKNASFNYHIDSESYGVVECVHQIFLHGVV